LIVYPNAPHSFFDRKQEEFQQESTDAWQHILSFIAAHTPPATQAPAQA
jgi:carboxymethylenebutenolidase